MFDEKKMNTNKQQKRINELQRQLAAANKRSKPSKAKRPTRGKRGVGVPKNLITPFDSAPGAKVPDQASSRSLTFRSRDQVVITPSQGTASDQGAFTATPSQVNSHYASATFTGTAVSAWGASTASQFHTSTTPAAERYRIVNFGVRVRSIGSALNAKGLLTVYTNYHAPSISGGLISLASCPADANETSSSKMVFPINSRLDVEFVGQPLDNDAFVYEPAGGQNKSWSWPTFQITGAGADVKLLFEVRYDLEWQALPNNSVSAYSSDAADYNPGLMAKLYNLYNHMPPVRQLADNARVAYGAIQQAAQMGETFGLWGANVGNVQPLLEYS